MTYLVMGSVKDKNRLLGYFTLATKSLCIASNSLSKTMCKRLAKFAVRDNDLKQYVISAPLIAQLGKNYNDGLNSIMSGSELLKIACDKTKEAQRILGGKFVYLECEDKYQLTEFYEQNGFINFGKRQIEKSEKDTLSGEYLIQMIKYLK